MQKVLTLYDTTIGKKAVMAVTGLVLFGFVIGHMLGNLQVFLGPAQLNAYGKKLHDLGPLLWGIRLVLLAAVVSHIAAAFQLWSSVASARPVRYRKSAAQAATWASRTMYLSGPTILFFLLYHLAHFTFPQTADLLLPDGGFAVDGTGHTDVYSNVVRGFSDPVVVGLYMAAQIFLGLHIFHGGWSLLQTLGLDHPQYRWPRDLARAVAIVVTVGNLAIPAAVFAGAVPPRSGCDCAKGVPCEDCPAEHGGAPCADCERDAKKPRDDKHGASKGKGADQGGPRPTGDGAHGAKPPHGEHGTHPKRGE